MARCAACGDPIGDLRLRADYLAQLGQRMAVGERFLCTACADEKFRGRLLLDRARLDSSGGLGPRHRPGDEASPYQENAIRAMEG